MSEFVCEFVCPLFDDVGWRKKGSPYSDREGRGEEFPRAADDGLGHRFIETRWVTVFGGSVLLFRCACGGVFNAKVAKRVEVAR